MNEQAVMNKMIAFIEAKERELQENKMSVGNNAKNDIVKSILEELERVIANENN